MVRLDARTVLYSTFLMLTLAAITITILVTLGFSNDDLRVLGGISMLWICNLLAIGISNFD